MSCKKGGLWFCEHQNICTRHNNLRDLTAKIVPEICKDTKIEPKLLPISGEELHGGTTNQSNEARLYIIGRGFWGRGQQVFFDIRVFDPNACRYLNKYLQQCYAMNELDKKRSYNERVLQVYDRAFTSLVFSIYVLREKYPYSELFWSVFSHIWTEYGEIIRVSPYSVRMRENTDQNNFEYGHFLSSDGSMGGE